MDELIGEFLAETNESLADLDTQLINLEQNPEDRAIIDSIFRVMHTIKGTCGFLGIQRLEKVAHASEDVLDMIRNESLKPTPEVISLVLKSIDQIKDLVETIEENGGEPEGSDSELIERLRLCAAGELGQTPAAEEASADEEGGEDSDDLQAAFDAAPGPGDEEPEGGTDNDDLQAAFDAAPGPDDAESEAGADNDALQAAFDAAPGPDDVPANTAIEKTDKTISDSAKEKAVEAGLAATKAEAEKAKEEEKDTAAKTPPAQFIRVNLNLLENLMQMASELVLTRNQLLQINRHDGNSTFSSPLQRLSHITSDLQEGVMKTRMQPISNAWAKFPRIVRDLAIELNKKIELEMIGQDTEIDRQMLEMVKDPLTHMVRNACDHGMDSPEERLAAGKPESGKVVLNAYHEGGNVIVKITDDGPGINVERVKQKAIENGLITEAEAENLSDKQIYQFILKPGFSTAEQVTSVSGRGVGMDVVVSNIEKIGGTLEVDSSPGKGSDFTVKLPLTLAIMSVLVVRSGAQSYAIPQIRVSEIVHAVNRTDISAEENDKHEFFIEEIKQSKVLRIRGELLPLVSLNDVLGVETEEIHSESDNVISFAPKIKKEFVVICDIGAHHFGIVVDRVFDTEEIVVKPLAPMLRDLDIFSGCTILGDGSVIMILDPNGLLKTMGNVTIRKEEDKIDKSTAGAIGKDDAINFLLFKAGGKAPKAVPVELISRLEEIDLSKTEWAGDKHVVQYRDDLMRLITADDTYHIPNEGIAEVIVFNDEGRVMGLVVEHIIDITEHTMDVRSMTGGSGVLGSLVISKTTYDLIDVGYYFSNVFSDWLATRGMENDNKELLGNDDVKKILLIDDSPFFRKFMKPILVVANYQVTTAEDAFDALEILESNKNFDAIITDIDMPGMTGLELAEKCKSDAGLAHIPIVALTSYASSDVKEKDKDNCFSGFVSKSDRDKLVDTIGTILQKAIAA